MRQSQKDISEYLAEFAHKLALLGNLTHRTPSVATPDLIQNNSFEAFFIKASQTNRREFDVYIYQYWK